MYIELKPQVVYLEVRQHPLHESKTHVGAVTGVDVGGSLTQLHTSTGSTVGQLTRFATVMLRQRFLYVVNKLLLLNKKQIV